MGGSKNYGPRGGKNIHWGPNISTIFWPPGSNISKYQGRGSENYGPGGNFLGGSIFVVTGA